MPDQSVVGYDVEDFPQSLTEYRLSAIPNTFWDQLTEGWGSRGESLREVDLWSAPLLSCRTLVLLVHSVSADEEVSRGSCQI